MFVFDSVRCLFVQSLETLKHKDLLRFAGRIFIYLQVKKGGDMYSVRWGRPGYFLHVDRRIDVFSFLPADEGRGILRNMAIFNFLKRFSNML